MTADIRSIVQEFIAFDPSLAQHRAMLEERLRSIRDARPEAALREEFRAALLAEIRARVNAWDRGVAGSTSSPQEGTSLFLPPSSLVMHTLHRFLFAGGGAVLGGLLVFVALNRTTLSPVAPTENDTYALNEAPSVLGFEAFGALEPSQTSLSAGRGGGGGVDARMALDAGQSETLAESDMVVLPYNPIIVKFTYDGEIPLPEGNVDVLRRRGFSMGAGSAVEPFRHLFDPSAIPGLRVTHLSLAQDRDLPYTVNLNPVTGTMDIYKTVDYRVREGGSRMDIAQMPDDASVIAVANAFLDQLGISRDGYGNPEMVDQWRFWYERAENKAEYYLPEMLTVVYPMQIDGKPVYDEFGNAVGLNVSVDIRDMQANSVFGLQNQSFDRSSYEGATDMARAREILAAGGVNMWIPAEGERVQATLGDPTEAYVRISRWDDRRGTGEDLFVPALAFPVTELPEKADQPRERVILPLAADMLTLPDPVVMPLMDGGMELR